MEEAPEDKAERLANNPMAALMEGAVAPAAAELKDEEMLNEAIEDMMEDIEETMNKVDKTIMGQLPKPLKDIITNYRAWRDKRRAKKEEEKEAQRVANEKKMKRQMRSLMRNRQSKYSPLNAWEIAYFKAQFKAADLDGDGRLTLEDVHELVMMLGEEPKQLRTWELLDSNAGRKELITQHELLVFLSIKRNDDANPDLATGPAGAMSEANLQRIKRLRRRRRQKGLPPALEARLERIRRSMLESTVPLLPPLGEFGREALGEERARALQRFIYSKRWWYVSCLVIVLSSGLLTVDIDSMVRANRLRGGTSLNTSASKPTAIPQWTVIAMDALFLVMTSAESLVKMATAGPLGFFEDAWHRVDMLVLLFSLLKLMFPDAERTLAALAAMRIFMLIPRVRELKKLMSSIIRSLPNMLVTMACCMVIWLIAAILGVTFFGGRSHQCAALSDTAGWPGCGVEEGSLMYTNPSACRYAPIPLPVPYGVVPGHTNASTCGCDIVDGVPALDTCTRVSMHGVDVAWVRAFPNFDNVGQALLALFQISTLDGWANIYYFAMDGLDAPHIQPQKEFVFLGPLVYYVVFIIFGVFFICNIFVGVVIDEFQKIKREYEGSAYLTDEQQQWVNTQKLIFRLRPERVQVQEPPATQPKRRWCFRLIYDADEHGLPSNAPEGAVYHGESFEQVISSAIALNILVMCLWTSPTIPTLNETDAAGINLYDGLNLFFVIVFSIEAALKIGAYTFKEYIKSTDNRFDFFLVFMSIVGTLAVMFADSSLREEPEMRMLRCTRALRIVRLSQVSPSLKKMMMTIAFATPSVVNILLILCIFCFAYAQVGMAFLGTLVYDPYGSGFNRHANFETFTAAFHFLCRMATGDAWSAQMADAYFNPHVPGVNAPPSGGVALYFLLFMMFMGWVLVSIFVAIILDYFNESGSEDGLTIAYEDIEEFQRKWLEFDVRNSGYISTMDVGLLLFSCNPPLVAVKQRQGGAVFDIGGEWVRPNLKQLGGLLRELDIPDHDGRLHFLEVLLALLQRITGVVSEEELMASLLKQHPKYLPSLKKMTRITGATSDPYIADEVMAHLRRGLEETGLIEDEAGEAEKRSAAKKASGGALSKVSGLLSGKRGSKEELGGDSSADEASFKRGTSTRSSSPTPGSGGDATTPSPPSRSTSRTASSRKLTQWKDRSMEDLEC